jgi:phosphatidylglycerophosphate synthase
MLDGLSKHLIDPIWERIATPLVRMKVTPNQVTVFGLVLVVLVTLAFLWHRSTLLFGLSLAVAFAFDALDGAVARRRNMQSKFGGYLDAVIDRYQELIVFLALGIYTQQWLIVMLGFSGGILTSYAKARTAIETPISNENWPDLFERLERVIFLCLLLATDGVITIIWGRLDLVLIVGLSIYALLTHATAMQRGIRAGKILRDIISSTSEQTPEKDPHYKA